jgi:hypothetical protein
MLLTKYERSKSATSTVTPTSWSPGSLDFVKFAGKLHSSYNFKLDWPWIYGCLGPEAQPVSRHGTCWPLPARGHVQRPNTGSPLPALPRPVPGCLGPWARVQTAQVTSPGRDSCAGLPVVGLQLVALSESFAAALEPLECAMDL